MNEADLKEQIEQLTEENARLRAEAEQLRALEDVYRARLKTVETIHGMKFAKAYGAVSRKAGKGDPFDSVRQELQNHEWIHLWIGNISYLTDKVRIDGWAVAPHDSTEYLRVVDAGGEIVRCSIVRRNRPDVNATWDIPRERKSGFTIYIKNEDLVRRPLSLQAESAHGMLTADLQLEPDREKRIAEWEAKRKEGVKSVDGPAITYDDWTYAKRRERGGGDAGADPKSSEKNDAQRPGAAVAKNNYEPLMSVVIPLYNTPERFLAEIVESVLGQTYKKIELCLADGSTEDGPENWIREHVGADSRVVYKRLADNKGIAENTNEAIRLAHGDFLVLSDHDDVVEKNAVEKIVQAINEEPDRVDLVYTDEDKITKEGDFLYDPFFKPDFDRDLLESYNYFTHIVAVRKSVAEEAGIFRGAFDGAQDYDFVLRCCEKAREIRHVPEALYHWRAHELSTAGNPESKLYAYENGRRALEEHFKRLGVSAKVEMTKYWGRYRSSYLCRRMPSLERIAVPGPGTRGIPRLLNEAAEKSGSEYLLFLREGAEGVRSDFESAMLGLLMQRPDVGAVGTRIIGPDGHIVSAGYILGIDGLAAPAFSDMSAEVFSYGGYANLKRGVIGVSADAMLVRREEFLTLGMFDTSLKESLYDLDFCLKLNQAGKKCVCDPYAEVELPRGTSNEPYTPKTFGNAADRKTFLKKWKSEILAGDPYFNKNLDHHRVDYAFDGEYL